MWQRWNQSTHIFEKSDDDGVNWVPLPLSGAIITEGSIPNVAYKNQANTFTQPQTVAGELYVSTGWIRTATANYGYYNQVYDKRFLCLSASYWGLEIASTGGGLRLYADAALSIYRGGIYGDPTYGFGLIDSAGNLILNATGGGNLQTWRHITQNSGAYIYPGSASGLTAHQTSFYLASHGSWGLYSNTGINAYRFYTGGSGAGGGYSFTIDNGTYVGCDVATRLVFGSSGSGGRVIYWDSVQIYPGNDGGQNLGHGGGRWGTLFAVTGTINTSDRKMKEDIKNLHSQDFLLKLRPVEFKWKDREDDKKVHHGFISQEVAEIYPDLGALNYYEGEATGINYSEFIAPIVVKIQEFEHRLRLLEGDLRG